MRVLAAVDFSPIAERTLRMAFRVIKGNGGSVDMVHAVHRVQAPVLGSPATRQLWAELQRDTTDVVPKLQALREQFLPADVHGEILIEDGAPDRVVLKHAGNGYDLVIIGTHGRTGLKAAVLGSVAEQVVRRAPCPVLVVR